MGLYKINLTYLGRAYYADKALPFMAKVAGASKVTARFQVTVPEDVRRILKIKIGQTLVFIHDGQNTRVEIAAEV